MNCFAVNDQYLIVSDDHKQKVVDLQTNKTNILSDRGVHSLHINNNKLISVYYHTIKIWTLNNLNLFKEFEDFEIYKDLVFYSSQVPIDADSKRLTVLATNGGVLIYDFTDNLRQKYLKYL